MSEKRWAGGLLGIHALTALHPGSGTALGTVDLPVQRERHTGWPNIAGSALKGILRDACRESHKGEYQDDGEDVPERERKTKRQKANTHDTLTQLFGPETANNEAHAGALSVTDARLIAYPVRSLKGVFAWVSCPAALCRAARDAELVGGKTPNAPQTLAQGQAVAVKDSPCLIDGTKLLLEEFPFARLESGDPSAWAKWIADSLLPAGDHYKATRERFLKCFVVLSDDDFTHFVKYATEVTARIGLDYETKTVKGGALFYQEFLPTESLFYAVALVNESRSKQKATAADLLPMFAAILTTSPVLQIGGDETTGKGFCSVRLMTGGAK